MGQVINIPSAGLDYVLYGDNRHVIANYIQRQLENIPVFINSAKNLITETLQNTYNYLTDNILHSNLKMQLENNNLFYNNGFIEQCSSFEQLQNANIYTQRYIMANPRIRELYLDNNIEGYGETYINNSNDIGVTHYDYRKVMDGVIQDTNNGFKIQFFNDDLYDGDMPLTNYEKVKIINTWEASNWLLDNTKFDFTNPSSLVKRGS